MFYLITFLPLSVLLVWLARTNRKIMSIIESKYYRILVDQNLDTRDKTPYAAMSHISYYDSTDNIIRSITELSSDHNTIKKLGNSELEMLCNRKHFLHRLAIGYLGFSSIAICAYWIYLLS